MKWREKRNPERWYTGPYEGRTIHYAKRLGVTYTVQARWRDWLKRDGPIAWYLTDGNGNNAAFATKEAAQAEAERRASLPDNARKGAIRE